MTSNDLSARLLILLGLVLACITGLLPTPAVADDNQDRMSKLVTTEWLSRHLGDSDLIVLDCTVRISPGDDGTMTSSSGKADFDKGHIPTAGFADLTGNLSDTSAGRSFVLPTPEQFCQAMGKLGVGDESRVVLYDSFNSVWAARVWWMLRWVGFDNAAVLDGGMAAWKAEGKPLSTDPATHKPNQLTVRLRPRLIAHHDEVLAAIDNADVRLIDVMPPSHYSGEMVMYGRPGHIPSAINVPSMALHDSLGCFKSVDLLAGLLPSDHDARTITYCGAGVAASANAFVMHRLGFTDVAVYMGSLQEWAADPDNPLVTE